MGLKELSAYSVVKLQKKSKSIKSKQDILQNIIGYERVSDFTILKSVAKEKLPEHVLKKKTKIVCTLGNMTYNFRSIVDMLKNGMNLARINMSSIQCKEHKILVRMIRKAADLEGL